MLEGFTALAYLAALHPQLKFGHSVLCQSFRNPALLAKMGATLHFLSNGQFILGLGAGWHAEEYRAYGYDFPADGVRVKQLEETLQIIKALWTQKTATFAGEYYRVTEAYCEPKPDPTPTIMVGAFKPKMLRLTAKYADWWNVSSTGVDGYRRMAEAFKRACADVGRDPSTVRRSWGGGCACAPTQAAAEALAGDGIQWVRLQDGSKLAKWETAWNGNPANNSSTQQPRLFLPSLLADPNIAFIAAYQGSEIIAGAIANRTDTVVGLSNVFAPPEDSVSFWAGCVATAKDSFPELPLVGYESGPELALAEAVGFEKLQTLRVWAHQQ